MAWGSPPPLRRRSQCTARWVDAGRRLAAVPGLPSPTRASQARIRTATAPEARAHSGFDLRARAATLPPLPPPSHRRAHPAARGPWCPQDFYIACSLGGVVACGATHTMVTPLDVVKCNMQTDPKNYTGIIQVRRLCHREPKSLARALLQRKAQLWPAPGLRRGVSSRPLASALDPTDPPQCDTHAHPIPPARAAGLPQDCCGAGCEGSVPGLGAHHVWLLGPGRVQGAPPQLPTAAAQLARRCQHLRPAAAQMVCG